MTRCRRLLWVVFLLLSCAGGPGHSSFIAEDAATDPAAADPSESELASPDAPDALTADAVRGDAEPGEDAPDAGPLDAAPSCTAPADCDDGIPCTVDACNLTLGCTHVPDSSTCSDGVLCTSDSCDVQAGCTHAPTDEWCDDGLSCTVDSCDPATDCRHDVDDSLCDDGVECTTDACDAAQGCVNSPQDAACDDANVCTSDLCDDQAGCVHGTLAGPCDDGDPCTFDDACQGSACLGTFQVSGSCLYAAAPNVQGCQAGQVSQAARMAALARVNYVRQLSGLSAVGYDYSADAKVQQAALMMAANAALDHQPPKTWFCWTQAGYNAAGQSNLHLGLSTAPGAAAPDEPIDAFLIDLDVPSLGHRRWLLNPFLKDVSYGAVDGKPKVPAGYPYVFAAVLKVMGTGDANLAGFQGTYVAYPVGSYPTGLFDKGWYLSFFALVDKKSLWANQAVDYSAATLTVSGPGGAAMPVTNVAVSNEGFGLPNCLQWMVPGLKDGVTYTVSLTKVKYKGQSLSYQYTFVLE